MLSSGLALRLSAFALLVGCSSPSSTPVDASVTADALILQPDAAIDAAVDAHDGTVPLPGFGTITGQCGVITQALLDGTTPTWVDSTLDFMNNRYDDPAERNLLTMGGAEIVADGNAGGSSVFSEVFAFEWLARCEGATLVASENEIMYDVDGKKADILVEIDGRKVGVSVTRAVKFPFGNAYTLDDAMPLIERKLDDLQTATTQVGMTHQWTAQMLVLLAYNTQHAQVAMQAWEMLDDETRAATTLVTIVTNGDDTFIYTDQ